MISVITSSVNKKNLECFVTSLKQTIGVPYELIIINNPGLMGICAAYNEGATQAKYDIVCFVHEDVEFLTMNWGLNIIRHFELNENAGVIGVAGAICKSKMPYGWIQPGLKSMNPNRVNIIQEYKHTATKSDRFYINPFNETRSLVVALDGVFLATKKEIWQRYPFEEKLLKGFHGYDIEFSLHIGTVKENYVVYDILLKHKSEGVFDLKWFEGVLKVYKKWNKLLPVSKSDMIGKDEFAYIDNYCFNELLLIKVSNKKEKYRKLLMCFQLIPIIGIKNFMSNHFMNFLKLLLNRHPLGKYQH